MNAPSGEPGATAPPSPPDRTPGQASGSTPVTGPPAYGGLRYGGAPPASGVPASGMPPAYGVPPGHGAAPSAGSPAGLPGAGREAEAYGGASAYIVVEPSGYPPLPEPGSGRGNVLVVRMLGLGLALLLIAAGAMAVMVQFFRQTTDVSTAMVGTVQEVIARTEIGDVFVHQGGPGQPLVVRRVLHWSFDRPDAAITRSGTTVNVVATCRRGQASFGDCSVDLDITLPPGAAIRINTGTGDIGADGVTGTIEATTRTGDIALHDLRSGTVTADTGTGDVTLALLTPPQSVRARTSAGDLRVIVPPDGTAYRISARTAVGDRRIKLPSDPNGTRTIDASTSLGDLTLITAP